MIKKYNKLIRDRILEIIKADGEKPYYQVLSKSEFQKEIKRKILEEARELVKARKKDEIINEIVDLQELIDVLITQVGASRLGIRQAQIKKNQTRGRFRKRLFLIRTEK